MSIFTLFTLAVGLSMDAFAVAVCKGLAMKKITLGKVAIVGLWFGSFQGLMPLAGYFLGVQFKDKITAIDHWIAFVLLGLIGINMIWEALGKEEECSSCKEEADLSVKGMFVLAVATSIDALAVGVTFAFFEGKYLVGRLFYRNCYLSVFYGRRKGGKCFRDKIQVKSRIGRRNHFDFSGE